MESTYKLGDQISEFISVNREEFKQKLLSEAVDVAAKINDILQTGNIDLLKNAEKLVNYVLLDEKEEMVKFANQEGVVWAEHALTLSFKLEWIQAIRRTLWQFVYHFDKAEDDIIQKEDFYILEKKINDQIDQFLNNFFLSYSTFKDELLNTQRKLVEHLSVPIIPVSPSVSVLPLIGLIDSYRMQTIEEKILVEISNQKVQALVIDLSGIADMEMDVIDQFRKVLNGVNMMGCKGIITGLRPDLVRKMVHAGISFADKAETKGTLQETLKKYLAVEAG
ncbi:STAS domain-containing protein [Neobacillus notoginsengisoli]|uniref:STAS domain-containing protein n=1 Tax=Neobacillus notoginsengisoli TaxID=1578198 RepID=A0A417YS39_9BACI|nr:STAS domain-containing protein [Neobacillus notoginsengisoli]RHW38117.1 STAS domain-containing protein [Neobacillus notoginsengisoli]